VEFKNGKKPLRLIKQLINWDSEKDSVVLDFFAGSGTTGHAVLDLNKEDMGNRQFILCTNNENKICENITFSRIKNITLDLKKSNLKYFKTALIPKSYNRDEMKIRITEECTEMLCIREGVYEEIKNKLAYRIFKRGDKVMAIYYFLSQKELPNLKKELDKMKGEKILYCFTLDPLGLNENDFDDWSDVRLEPIPQKILDIYKEIHEY
jgi:adenine-specific DNA-methyltransferase